MARRDDGEYPEYSREEQRRQAGCPAREVVLDQRRRATSWARAIAMLTLAAAASPAAAQSVERFSVETAAAIDHFGGDNAAERPQIIVDILASVRLGAGWQLYLRPWLRQPRAPGWDAQIYQAFVRYERQGRVAMRLDSGYIGSPIGLGLMDAGPVANPLVSAHSSYFAPMIPFETGGPRVSAVSSTYPLGSQLTLSTDRWDARGAVVSTTPTRVYAIGSDTNPRHTPALAAGGGVTPRIGLRLGISFARGAYLTRAEVTAGPPGDRRVTMLGVEGEYAFGYTKLAGEIVRDRFDTPEGAMSGYEWFLQGSQTLSPRWFVSARHEGTLSPVRTASEALRAQPRLMVVDATLGFRLTHEWSCGVAI
jgi:hypothetical protein